MYKKIIPLLFTVCIFISCQNQTNPKETSSSSATSSGSQTTSSASTVSEEFTDWKDLCSSSFETTIEDAKGKTTLLYSYRTFSVCCDSSGKSTGDYFVLRIQETFSDEVPYSESHKQNASYSQTWYKKYFLHNAAFGSLKNVKANDDKTIYLEFANKTFNSVNLSSTESIKDENLDYGLQGCLSVKAETSRTFYIPAVSSSNTFTYYNQISSNRYIYGIAFYNDHLTIEVSSCASSDSSGPSAGQNAQYRNLYYSEVGTLVGINNDTSSGYSYKNDGTFCTIKTSTKSIYPKISSGQFVLN